MRFFQRFYKSLFDLGYLRSERGKPGRAWGYAVLFLFLVSVIQLAPVIYRIPGWLREARAVVEREVPEFTARARAGELSVEGVEQPYVRTVDTDDGSFKIIIDTVSTTTPDIAEFLDKNTDSGVLVGRTEAVVYSSGDGRTQAQSFSDLPAREEAFTKQDLLGIVDQVQSKGVYLIGAVMIFAFFIFLLIGKLIYLFFISLIAFMIAAATKRTWRLGEIYTVGLYALTLPTLIQTIGRWLGYPLTFVYTIVLGIVLFGAVFYQEDGKTEGAAGPA
ncbi:MAG: hypothetical protein UY92_C0001G0072 [Candidatus Magasanikbacteria bacterium GW2011_GWA2_56_11]|uniref:DUF1189 domain-containing protein n=1 Tax=Candidatus Magasanikbacteria bacterium GW2011_GWA2_56_11 TaxID=1619044 RepID=A0A0G1YHZ9_9BACT|nr:MAG: hypothetical protein UY92_C0001G0072 [Candidatus Magasanikbacteria bacterium GW2011_GWA2_56_11]